MHSNACPIGIKTIALLCKEEISIQEKQVDFISSFVQSLLFFVIDGRGWLKIPPKRKFRELKTADEEKAKIRPKILNTICHKVVFQYFCTVLT